ncbi:MAG: hypothetical protein ACK4FE_01250 [Azonexus sp.]
MSFALRLTGLFRASFLVLLFSTLSPAYGDSRENAGELPLSRHTLVLPANLPHLAWVLKGQTAALGLDETQRNTLAALAFEARDTLQPRLQEARNVERAIAAATLEGKDIAQLAGELDRLQQLKWQATDAQIDLNGRIRAALTPEQYGQLLRLAQSMPDAGPGVIPGKDGMTPAAALVLPDYALISPRHLPHLMNFIGQLSLDAARRQSLEQYADQTVRPNLLPLLREAQQLERAIGRAVLDGEGQSAVVGQLDRLLQLKRQAAEIHIRCIAQVRQILPADQYSQLLALARETRP